MEDLYLILGVQSSATIEEIKKAFHKLALVHHPDKNGGESIEFCKIKNAYDILSDPLKRDIYDNNNTKSIVDWKSFMRDVFANMYVMFSAYIIPKDVSLNIAVDFEDIYFKRVKKIEVRVKRWVESNFISSKQIIYVPLNNFKNTHTFEKLGDDSILVNNPRSNIIVNLSITNMPNNTHMQDVFSEYDLYIIKHLSLFEFYKLELIPICICNGVTKYLNNLKEYNYIINDIGLPFNIESRGDVYVKIIVDLPKSISKDCLHLLETDFSFKEN